MPDRESLKKLMHVLNTPHEDTPADPFISAVKVYKFFANKLPYYKTLHCRHHGCKPLANSSLINAAGKAYKYRFSLENADDDMQIWFFCDFENLLACVKPSPSAQAAEIRPEVMMRHRLPHWHEIFEGLE